MSTLPKLSLVLVVLVLVYSASGKKQHTNKARLKFLRKKHGCKPSSEKEVADGFAEYAITEYTCNDSIIPAKFEFVKKCPKSCQDPEKRKSLKRKKYRVYKIKDEQLFRPKIKGSDFNMTLIKGCGCMKK